MSEAELGGPIEAVAALIIRSRKIVVFTGAGVSTESGIPDFRSPGGIWSRYAPVMYQDFLASHEARRQYWKMQKERYPDFAQAQPNPAHHAVAELERLGKLDCVITQNIDGLHQRAGNSPEKVIELHGNGTWVLCLRCGRRLPREEVQKRLEAGEEVPTCEACGGLLKPATVSFGQPMPDKETWEAEARSRHCDLFMVIGSTLVVYPAAQMPVYALEGGARLVIINLSETPLDPYATVVLRGKAGETMAQVIERVKAKMEDA